MQQEVASHILSVELYKYKRKGMTHIMQQCCQPENVKDCKPWVSEETWLATWQVVEQRKQLKKDPLDETA